MSPMTPTTISATTTSTGHIPPPIPSTRAAMIAGNDGGPSRTKRKALKKENQSDNNHKHAGKRRQSIKLPEGPFTADCVKNDDSPLFIVDLASFTRFAEVCRALGVYDKIMKKLDSHALDKKTKRLGLFCVHICCSFVLNI